MSKEHVHQDVCQPHPHPTGTLYFAPCDDGGCEHHGWHDHQPFTPSHTDFLFTRHSGPESKNLHPFMD